MSELQIQHCEVCATSWFPDRLRCPDCDGTLTKVPAGEGRVEEQTTLRRQDNTKLASVRLDAGPVVIARVSNEAPNRVRLEVTPDGAIWVK